MAHPVPRSFDDNAADLIGVDCLPSAGDRFDLEVAKLLVARKALSLTGLANAMRLRAERGISLADAILATGLLQPADYYRAVADCYGLPFVDLQAEPADPSLGELATLFQARSMLPWRRRDGRLILAVSSVSRETVEWADVHLGETGYDFVIAAPLAAN